jgi:hypothetical protein
MLYILIFSILINFILLYFCIKFGITIIKIQEIIEECLDVIDEKYNNVVRILEIPVFSDSPEIKRMINELDQIKLSIIYIANKLSMNDLRTEEEKDEEFEK